MFSDVHRALGATFKKFDPLDLELPFYYKNIETEYQAIQTNAGLMDFSFCGRLLLKGKDALDLLHRLSTNDIKSMTPGEIRATALTNEKGRVVDFIRVYRDSDHVLLSCAPQNDQKISKWLDRYIIRDDVKVELATEQWDQFEISGPNTAALIEKLFNRTMTPGRFQKINFAESELTIAPSCFLKSGASLIVRSEKAEELWRLLFEKGLAICGWEAFDRHRIEQKIPLYHRELSEKYNPLEAGLYDAVSFTKGCYIGQEVIARLDSYNKVQRQMHLFKLTGNPLFENKILTEDKEIGNITSSAFSITHQSFIGLGYVKTEFVKNDVEFSIVDAEKKLTGTIL